MGEEKKKEKGGVTEKHSQALSRAGPRRKGNDCDIGGKGKIQGKAKGKGWMKRGRSKRIFSRRG